jgi:adenylate cyclase
MFRFEEFTLDPVRGSLRSAQHDIELRPKSFEVLCYLVENAGRLVTKDELIRTVWPDVTVTDESLTQCVSEVRQALGDGAQNVIRTVPRRGYRFAAPVAQVAGDGAAPSMSAATAERTRAGRGEGERPAPPLPDRPSIAVLPFVNLSGDPQQEYFSDGITDDIITELSRFSDLLVIARNSTFQYKGKAIDIRQIGRDLGVRYILEGSIRRSGDRIRINAQLIDAVTGAHRWADRYDRELSDVFAVQDEVTRAIVALLAAHVNKAEAERTLLKPPATWEAYDYYLRGVALYFLGAGELTAASLQEAGRLLERSLSIDPRYARAYGMLATTYVSRYNQSWDGDYLNPAMLDRAYHLASKGVQVDGNLPEAHAHLGWVLMFKRQHDPAIAEFERALTLNSNFVDPRFAHVLANAGEPARAVEMLHAQRRFDPFRAINLGYLGHAYYLLKRYADALPPLRECSSRQPNFQIYHLWLAATYAQLGQRAEAEVEAAEVLRMCPEFTIAKWKPIAVCRNPADAEHTFDGLRKAGLPEG